MIGKIAILDAGAQYLGLIDKNLRKLRTKTQVMPMETSLEDILKENLEGIVISGGPDSVNDENSPKIDPRLLDSKIPILGICYGAQIMAHLSGAEVGKEKLREDGQTSIQIINKESLLFKNLPLEQRVLLTHGDSIKANSSMQGFSISALSKNGVIAAIEDSNRKLYGVQFHPETTSLTEHGLQIFDNFLEHIVKSKRGYDIGCKEQEAIKQIRDTVGEKNVLILASGGVDSTVTATLLAKSLRPNQIYAVHIDNGLMREKESQEVANALQELGVDLIVHNGTEDFLNGTTIIDNERTNILCEETNPQIKRVIIGDTFMHISNKVIKELGLDPNTTILAQGTLRTDLIESGSHIASKRAAVIKTHHNDTDLVRKLRTEERVIEPLNELYKDDVREIGEKLGLSKSLVWRQPFPGPGLGVRVICASEPYICNDFESTNEKLKALVEKSGLNATLMPIRTVGVQGDGRTYSYPVVLTGEENWEKMFDLTTQITNQLHNVNRIIYSPGDRIEGPLTTITPTYLTKDVLSQIRTADNIVNETLLKYNLTQKLSQVPVILFPVDFGINGERGVAIRTFITNDFMTGVPAMPGSNYMPHDALQEMFTRIPHEVPGISRVGYDLTSKPPGTTEWE